MRKLINDPYDFVDEVIDGLLAAHPTALTAGSTDRRVLVRGDGPKPGRVGIVTGGGSGHLPVFLGYVGPGLATAVAIGNVFSSPSDEQTYQAAKAADADAGILFLYGNYSGDVFVFDEAAERLTDEGVPTQTVLVTDDVASAPSTRRQSRRGIAGMYFAFKCAGAAAERGDGLADVAAAAQRAVARTATMGVGLSPTILPTTGVPTFTLDEGEMEIGIGIHGEPGVHRGPLETADAVATRLTNAITDDLELDRGDQVAVLVNGLGATPAEELYLLYRRAAQLLTARGIQPSRVLIGEYATSLEMAGASISLLHLDEDLLALFDAPASSPLLPR